METISMTYCKHFDNGSYGKVCIMSLLLSLAVVFIIRLFSTSAFREPTKS